jgi:hypothetical protein
LQRKTLIDNTHQDVVSKGSCRIRPTSAPKQRLRRTSASPLPASSHRRRASSSLRVTLLFSSLACQRPPPCYFHLSTGAQAIRRRSAYMAKLLLELPDLDVLVAHLQLGLPLQPLDRLPQVLELTLVGAPALPALRQLRLLALQLLVQYSLQLLRLASDDRGHQST